MEQHQKVGLWTLDRKIGDRWLCICDCGSTRFVLEFNLRHRKTKSCGCVARKAHELVMDKVYPREVHYGVR